MYVRRTAVKRKLNGRMPQRPTTRRALRPYRPVTAVAKRAELRAALQLGSAFMRSVPPPLARIAPYVLRGLPYVGPALVALEVAALVAGAVTYVKRGTWTEFKPEEPAVPAHWQHAPNYAMTTSWSCRAGGSPEWINNEPAPGACSVLGQTQTVRTIASFNANRQTFASGGVYWVGNYTIPHPTATPIGNYVRCNSAQRYAKVSGGPTVAPQWIPAQPEVPAVPGVPPLQMPLGVPQYEYFPYVYPRKASGGAGRERPPFLEDADLPFEWRRLRWRYFRRLLRGYEDPVREYRYPPLERPRDVARPRLALHKRVLPNKAYVKEVKATLRTSRVAAFYGLLTEVNDVLDAFVASIRDNHGNPICVRRTVQARVACIVNNFDRLDGSDFLYNLASNQIEDAVIGRIAGYAGKAYRRAIAAGYAAPTLRGPTISRFSGNWSYNG